MSKQDRQGVRTATDVERKYDLGKLAESVKKLENYAVESDTYAGCYFRMVREEVEWLNPPMMIGTEYRTTERYNGKAVYIKNVAVGLLPNATTKILDGVVTDGCTGFTGVCCQRVYSGLSIIPSYDGTYGWLIITSNSDLSGYSEVATIKYTKE